MYIHHVSVHLNDGTLLWGILAINSNYLLKQINCLKKLYKRKCDARNQL